MLHKSMLEVVKLMEKYPWLISYDNINIPFHVFSQRLDNRGELGNGTMATIYINTLQALCLLMPTAICRFSGLLE